jgi:hypothetical protein
MGILHSMARVNLNKISIDADSGPPKGQIISKALFDVIVSTKKTTKFS